MIVIAQIRVFRRVRKRVQHVGRGHVQIVEIQAVVVDDALDLLHARPEGVVGVARRGGSRIAIDVHHKRREAERLKKRSVASRSEARDESDAHDDDDDADLDKAHVARPRSTGGRRNMRSVSMLGHGRSTGYTLR
jgi:hypothetical protein